MSNVQRVNLQINQGATFRYRFPWVDKKGRAIDLTNFTGRMQIRASVSSPVILISLTTENGGLTLGDRAGTVTLFVDSSVTAGFAWTKGVYDIELVSPSGDVFRMVGGSVNVDPEVTR